MSQTITSTNNDAPRFGIYCMSHNRYKTTTTKDMVEYCTYVVRENQAELYKKNGITDLISIPDGKVFDFMSTLYWIIENTKEDVICILDDDIKGFLHRTDFKETLDKETSTMELERIGQLIYDLNIGYAFDTPTTNLYIYNAEFVFKGMPGHVRWINKKALKAKYDKNDPASSDVDMMYQELLKNRVCLQPKYFCSYALMDTNDGSDEDRQQHINLTLAMSNKWGNYYKYDYKKNTAHINIKR